VPLDGFDPGHARSLTSVLAGARRTIRSSHQLLISAKGETPKLISPGRLRMMAQKQRRAMSSRGRKRLHTAGLEKSGHESHPYRKLYRRVVEGERRALPTGTLEGSIDA
jgi:hypothetical protein